MPVNISKHDPRFHTTINAIIISSERADESVGAVPIAVGNQAKGEQAGISQIIQVFFWLAL
jgi:hypothetical protein